MARIKIEFEDTVSRKLEYLGREFPMSLERVLKHVTTVLKGYTEDRQKREYGDRLRVKDGEESRGYLATKFKKTGRARYRLQVHPRFQILETGGDIFPKNKEWLVFQIDGQWIRTNVVDIPKRPTFKPSLRDAIRNDAINKAAEQSIDLEFERLKLK